VTSIKAGLGALVAAMIVALALGGATGTAAQTPKGKGKPVIFDLFGEELVKPERIFLTANSGPYLDDITWSRWGKDGADGEATLVSDCASCAPPERRPATIRLRRVDSCAKRGGLAFRRFKFFSTDENGDPASRAFPTGWSVYCKKKKD
jgi:hypothetical protein